MRNAPFDSSTATPVRFRADGSFKIMHITDTHLNDRNMRPTLLLISNACDTENPDLVVLTGDIVMSDYITELKYRIASLMQIFEKRHIPVAVCFGNHETESGIVTRSELMAIYNTFACSISVDEGSDLPGCGTYHIPVLSSNDGTLKFNIWLFDTHGDDGEGHYSNVAASQVAWYKKRSAELRSYADKPVPSFVFQHTIVPEVYLALKKVKYHFPYAYKHMYEHDFYAFDSSNCNFGLLHETPCCGYHNHGQFHAMAECGDVLAMFTGHDHTNAFGVRYRGIDIVNSLSTRFNGDGFSTQYGYRMIEIHEKMPNCYKTKVVHWYDVYKLCNISEYISKDSGKVAAAIALKGLPPKFIRAVGIALCALFGRKVKYSDS